jgi:hypothetical protein
MLRTPNADAVAAYITNASSRAIPEAVLDAARMCLVDWFGVAIGAYDEGAAPGSGASAHNNPTPWEFMTDEQQLADAFWQMNRAVIKINEILDRNPALAENLPVTPPRILDADEIAAECQVLAEYYEKLARWIIGQNNV